MLKEILERAEQFEDKRLNLEDINIDKLYLKKVAENNNIQPPHYLEMVWNEQTQKNFIRLVGGGNGKFITFAVVGNKIGEIVSKGQFKKINLG